MKLNSSGRDIGIDDKYQLTPDEAEPGIAVTHTSLMDTVSLDVPSLATKTTPQVVDTAVVYKPSDGQYYQASVGTLLNVPALTCRVDVYRNVQDVEQWDKPAGASWIHTLLVSGGGGGGSGYKNGTGPDATGSGGAGGGGSGAIDQFMWPAALFPDRCHARVGAGGLGNASQIDLGGGVAGAAGGTSQFGIMKSGVVLGPGGGAGGGAGSTTGGTGGGGGTSYRYTSGAGGTGNEAGAGSGGATPGGGGGAGGFESNNDHNGAAGARGWAGDPGGSAGLEGAMVGDATNGGNAYGAGFGLEYSANYHGGGGGGGGGTGAYSEEPGFSGGDGGHGGFPGGGGGGGGGCTRGKGNKSGYGGTGGQGQIIISTFF